MKTSVRAAAGVVLALAVLALFPRTVVAQSGTSDIRWKGWGPRIGIASDPDQVVGGVQFDMGEFRPQLRFQPDVQLGLGDDATTLFGTLPVHYHFDVDESFTPYAGGGVVVGLIDRDLPPTSNADDTSFEIGLRVTGGLEWTRRNRGAFALELSLGLGDVPEAQVVALWNFGR